jgi:hypothetical protein
MVLNDVEYTVQLVARRGTGFSGYRVTLHFIPHDGTEEIQIELANASSTADFHRIARELSENQEMVAQKYAQAHGA